MSLQKQGECDTHQYYLKLKNVSHFQNTSFIATVWLVKHTALFGLYTAFGNHQRDFGSRKPFVTSTPINSRLKNMFVSLGIFGKQDPIVHKGYYVYYISPKFKFTRNDLQCVEAMAEYCVPWPQVF